MFQRNLFPVWICILLLSGMFLMGQDTWPPSTCVDDDEDGYGSPESGPQAQCPFPGVDCDDTNPDIHPGVIEAPYGDPICIDGLDNDCDSLLDRADQGCQQCTVPEDCDDGNPCTDDDCVDHLCVYTNNTDPCDDADACTMDDLCSGGVCLGVPLDADRDTYVSDVCGGDDCDDADDDVYPAAPEICDQEDNQCPGDPGYGEIDEGCDMVPIPAGCFDMGDSAVPAEGDADELPVHPVCISAFDLDVHEVTNAEYAACVAAGGCTLPRFLTSWTRTSYYGNPAYDNFPVIWVDWQQATNYCTWNGKRLPTEAEWEYAARGGLAGKRYPLGDEISGSDANYYNSGDPWDNDTSEVAYYAPNGYGVHDMAGNVWEWVNDWYNSTYYQYCVDNGIVNNPPGPASGTQRGVRSGSWSLNTLFLRVASRAPYAPTYEYANLGIRCAR